MALSCAVSSTGLSGGAQLLWRWSALLHYQMTWLLGPTCYRRPDYLGSHKWTLNSRRLLGAGGMGLLVGALELRGHWIVDGYRQAPPRLRLLRHFTETALFGVAVTYWWSDSTNQAAGEKRKTYLRSGKSTDIHIPTDIDTRPLLMRFSIPVRTRVLRFDCEGRPVRPTIDQYEQVGREYAISGRALTGQRNITVTARPGRDAPEIPEVTTH